MCATGRPRPFPLDDALEIPSIPLVLVRIIQTLERDDSSGAELERLILHDPALTARILKLANSAFYSFHADVRTISHAVSLLGLNLVTSLAIGIKVFDTFVKGKQSEASLINGLWTHSCAVGVLAREIWTRRSRRAKEAEFAFLCGLLHDLGKAALFQTYPGHYGSIFAIRKREADPAIASFEIDNYGVDHAAVGAMLARQWGFPQELSSVIRRHHDRGSAVASMAIAVGMADLLAKTLGIGYDGDDGLNENASRLRAILRMDDSEYDYLNAFAGRERTSIEGFFDASQG